MHVKSWRSKIFAILFLALAVSLPFTHVEAEKSNDADVITTIPVEVAVAKIAAIPTTVLSVGSLVALRSIDVSSEVDGRVEKILYHNGDSVSAGMPVIQLDSATSSASLASAEAAYRLSETTYSRYLLASKQGAVSEQDLDQKKADMESQAAAVKEAQAAFDQTTIQAPFDGVLGAFAIHEGAFINKGAPLVSLVDRHKLRIDYSLPERYLAELALGQKVNIQVDAYPEKVFSGVVTFISPKVDVDTSSVSVEATIDNADNALSPGMFCHVTHILSINPHAIVIPEQAIVAGLQGDSVFVVVDGHAQQIGVEVAAHTDGLAVISKGIQAGDKVIIAGQQKVNTGQKVTIQP